MPDIYQTKNCIGGDLGFLIALFVRSVAIGLLSAFCCASKMASSL